MGADHKRLFHITAMMLGLAMAHAGAAADAHAEQRRVVVVKFKGDSDEADRAREAVLDVLGEAYELISFTKYRIAKRRLGIRRTTMKSLAKVARKLSADAIVMGEVKRGRLKLQIREGSSGRRIPGQLAVKLGRKGLSSSAREHLTMELVDFIDATEPIGSVSTIDDSEADEAPKASLATAAKASRPTWAIDTVEKLEAEEKKESKPSSVRLSAALGATGVIRSLQFAAATDLSADERPVQQNGSPALSVALIGTLEILPLGITAEVSYEKSVGAKLSFPDGNMTRQISVGTYHLAGRLIAERKVGERYAIHGNVGYGQLSYAITNRPNGLLLPDTRYGYLHVGGGARVRFRNDDLALVGNLNYLHVVAIGGISAPNFYGTAAARGFRGEGALEIKSSATSYVRLGVRGTQISMAFAGDGTLATELDESSDVDVSGARDLYVGGFGLVGFYF